MRKVHLEHDGRRMLVSEWAREFGLDVGTLRHRLKAGWSVERALTEPSHRLVKNGEHEANISREEEFREHQLRLERLRKENTHNHNEGNRLLWSAVILQAVEDATRSFSKSNNWQKQADVTRAREWLTVPNKDFDEVCELAGLEPDRVRAYATAQIAKVIADPPKQRQRYGWAPGVGPNFSDGSRDQWTRSSRDAAFPDFSQDSEPTPCP